MGNNIKSKKKFLSVFNFKAHYISWSSNQSQSDTKITLFHGDMRTSRSFDYVSKKLALYSHVYAYDFLGHGDSDWPGIKYRLNDRSREIIHFTQNITHSKCIGIGHSNGAVALTLAALQKPHLFQKIILMEPMLIVDENFQKMVSKRKWRTWNDLDELKQTLQSHDLTKNWDQEVTNDVLNYETFKSGEGIGIKWDKLTMAWDHRKGDYLDVLNILPKLEMPVLFIISETHGDKYSKLDPLISQHAHFNKTTIHNSGHNMYMEQPDTVSNEIQEFIH
tara:strand:- start:3143 stop:3973 length:831 start_codon:yes stop_codon:yes gene_type:complete